MKIDKIILACDNRSHYVQCLPLARHAWYAEYGLEPEVYWLDFDGAAATAPGPPAGVTHVVDCRALDTRRIHSGNAAQTVRIYAAAVVPDPDAVVMLGDIDLMPLNTGAYKEAVRTFDAERGLLSWGANAYRGTEDDGKFQMNYLCGAARHFRRCAEYVAPVGPNVGDYARWLAATAERVHAPDWHWIDRKEDLYLDFGTYSDESLLRCLMHRTGVGHTSISRRLVPAGLIRPGCVLPYVDRIDRSRALGGDIVVYDAAVRERMMRGEFSACVADGSVVDVHVMRPFQAAAARYSFLYRHLGLRPDRETPADTRAPAAP